jgi:glycosyltransferase involved in cell wall biosynthesis
MKFSILIANYNNGHFFSDCYQSILKQTYQNWEVIIVDDCSTDDSVDVIKRFIADDDRFKLIVNDKNRGCGYTKNKCASIANGEILGFLDPDDALKANAVMVMVLAHIERPEVALISSKYELVDLEMNCVEKSNQGGVIPEKKSYLTSTQGLITHFATFKKDKYWESKGINPVMKRAVDQDLYYKLEEQGGHFFINEYLYLYRINENSISANENVFKARYWHFYAMIQAYKRRKKLNLDINNFSENQIKKIKSNYYLSRFERAKELNLFCNKYYFLIKSIIAFPRYKLRYKLKSFAN